MKKIIILLIIALYSCKKSETFDDTYAIDSTVTVIDTNAISIDTISTMTSIDSIEEISTRELTYEDAMVTSSKTELQDFIVKNPNHEFINKLKARLIDLEVDVFLSDEKTGVMPASDKISESNSRVSEVSIKNNTSCDLEVRYSGVESKMIVISPHESASISLISGNYRVVASACGSNYAGSELLSGNYSSSYYITTTYR